jgi:NADPH:quinone reductase-like Zn-dependent oxidoreductase
MKAVVLHEYGPPKNLKYEDFADPQPGPGEVLIRVQAAGVNPVDWKMRSGAAKERFPVQFPGILGRDAAGIVREVGPGVEGFAAGDHVFALTWHTYAELAVAPASELAKIPEGLELTTAAAIPLVSVTGDQLIRDGAKAEKGQTILLTGALGSVGRIALHAAREIGANVIAGVRKDQVAEALKLGAVAAIDLADKDAIASLGLVDAIADTIGGATAVNLIGKVKPGGHYGSVVGPPSNAVLHPTVQIHAFMAHPDAKTYVHYGEAIRDKKLILPIDRMMPLAEAAQAHALGEKGGVGKLILLA